MTYSHAIGMGTSIYAHLKGLGKVQKYHMGHFIGIGPPIHTLPLGHGYGTDKASVSCHWNGSAINALTPGSCGRGTPLSLGSCHWDGTCHYLLVHLPFPFLTHEQLVCSTETYYLA